MLIAISKYLKPLNEVDAQRPGHIEFLKKLQESGKLILSGRQNPPTGGVIIVNIQSVDEFQQILTNDPFVKLGVAEYKIIEFNPAVYHKTLSEIFKK